MPKGPSPHISAQPLNSVPRTLDRNISPATQLLRQAVRLAREAGCYIAIDMASYNVVESNDTFLHDIVEQYVDIVFANETEAESFTRHTPREAVDIIAGMCDIAVVKIGARGSYIRSGDEFHHIEACPAEVKDATGAGDLYAAGFLYAHALGMPLDVCGRVGSITASKVVHHRLQSSGGGGT